MGMNTMDSIWWGSCAVFGAGCAAAVITGANKDSAYGKWKQRREEREAMKALELKKLEEANKKNNKVRQLFVRLIVCLC